MLANHELDQNERSAIGNFLSVPHAIVYAQFRTVGSRYRIISIRAVVNSSTLRDLQGERRDKNVDNLAKIGAKQDATGFR
jgi:hypothetical protein